jgi:hypothetical protein
MTCRGENYQSMAQWAKNNGYYDNNTGMQPSDLVTSLDNQFGSDNVTEYNNWSLNGMYSALKNGERIIVDIRVSKRNGQYVVDPNGNTIAHFSRVFAIDPIKQMVYLFDTLNDSGTGYWAVSYSVFLEAWKSPEISATEKPTSVDRNGDGKRKPINLESVNRWGVAIKIE